MPSFDKPAALPRFSPASYRDVSTLLWIAAFVIVLAVEIELIFGAKAAFYVLSSSVGLASIFLGPRLLLGCVILVSATAGAMSSLEGLAIGSVPISLSGLTTALITGGAAFSLYVNRAVVQKRWVRDFLPFWIFGAFALLRCFGSSAGPDAWRQAFLIVAPLSIALLTNVVLTLRPQSFAWIESAFALSVAASICVLLCTVFVGFIESTPEGFISIFGRRSLALYMMIMLVWGLAQWRYGENLKKKRIGFYISVATLTVILTTLSRTTSVVALLCLVPLRFVKVTSRSLLSIFAGPVLGIILLGCVLLWSPVRERFLGEGSRLDDVRDVSSAYADLNTSGRNEMWAGTFMSALESPIFGHGTGTASAVVELLVPGLEHPHNDYLRVFHDQGLVGLLLFLWAWGERILRHWRKWKSSSCVPPLVMKYRMTGFLLAVSVSLSFVTDNLMLYEFILMPSYLVFAMSDFIEREGTNASAGGLKWLPDSAGARNL